MSVAGIAAASWVALTQVVVRALPFQFTVDALTKFDPFTVKLNVVPPAVAPAGESDEISGIGMLGGVIVKLPAPLLPPPGGGLVTTTFADPAAAMSVAGIAAVICVGLTYVVARGEPFQLTTDFVRSEEPLTVSVNPSLPAAAEVGEIVVRIGTGLGLEELELQPVSKPARARSERADTFDDTTWAYAIRSPSPILEQPDRSCC